MPHGYCSFVGRWDVSRTVITRVPYKYICLSIYPTIYVQSMLCDSIVLLKTKSFNFHSKHFLNTYNVLFYQKRDLGENA